MDALTISSSSIPGNVFHDLSRQRWRVAGLTPEAWRMKSSMEIGIDLQAEVGPIPAQVPGSVQKALWTAGLLPDWNLGLNHRCCEWVENRHWIFECDLPEEPPEPETRHTLEMQGLDHQGIIFLNGEIIAEFDSAFHPWTVDLTERLAAKPGGKLGILFLHAPRWMGQFGRTSQMTAQKPRFNFGWDWIPRMMQIGIWDRIGLHRWKGARLRQTSARTDFSCMDSRGHLVVLADVETEGNLDGFVVQFDLRDGTQILASGKAGATKNFQMELDVGKVKPWWPNGLGLQKLYTLHVRLMDPRGALLDERNLEIGFRHIEWKPCEKAPKEADPWLCVVNGRPVFLQGFNWTPILPNFADVSAADHTRLLKEYQRMGCNTLRVWGGAARERDGFYQLCDQLGLMIWQEFPLSSSGVENAPPRAPSAMKAFLEAARWTICFLRHHACLLLWCGGNELTEDRGNPDIRVPATLREPLLASFAELVATEDMGRRFLPSSPSGPSFNAFERDYGKGIHWHVHGPWKMSEQGIIGWKTYWAGDDSLFRSEVGSPGASSVSVIEKYSGGEPVHPCRNDHALWRRTSWWTEWEEACRDLGREPESLAEYANWSRERQAAALQIAAQSCKSRFPQCGGFLVWMGHDCFPCAANTSVIDFDGHWKPAAFALQKVFLDTKEGRFTSPQG